MDDSQSTPAEEEAARLAELEKRAKALGKNLDELEEETARKQPDPPAIGGMVGT